MKKEELLDIVAWLNQRSFPANSIIRIDKEIQKTYNQQGGLKMDSVKSAQLKELQVREQLQIINASLDNLEGVIENFNTRLVSVLQCPSELLENTKPTADLVPLAYDLHNISSRIGKQTEFLKDLLNRMEL